MATADYDLIVRNGTVVDGSGGTPFEGDVAVKDGRIAAVGQVWGRGVEEIDARDRIVAPGFVDVHTHYDGQATWDQRMAPSSWHGVTTVVIGNCGVGFAPCRPDNRERLVKLMEGVEDIPFPVLTAGLPWDWESFPSYLDALERRRFDVDIATQLPHAALRVHVMGQRGADREPATEGDIAAMAALAMEAMEAGALGFSTSRTLNHRTSEGQPTPTLTAGEDELTGIAAGMAKAFGGAGAGALQVVSDFHPDGPGEFAMLRRIVERTGRPLSFTLAQSHAAPDGWRALLAGVERAVDDGLAIRAQVSARAVGVLFGLELTLNPFSFHPTYRDMAHLPLDERVRRLGDPQTRARLLAETADPKGPFAGATLSAWSGMYPLAADRPDYEPTREQTVAARAEAAGCDPRALALDHLLSRGGRGLLYLPFLSYGYGSLDASFDMLSHRDTVPGLSDGGAHVGMICDASFPTSLLTHWTRDRTRGPRLPLPFVIKRQAADTAALVGLHDRGRLTPGLRADLNVIDYDRLTLHAPEAAYDLPAGGRRLVQRAGGYVATVVAGQVTYRDGVPTAALPGRLVPGARGRPAPGSGATAPTAVLTPA